MSIKWTKAQIPAGRLNGSHRALTTELPAIPGAR